MWPYLVSAFLFGAFLGSFVNVLIYRIPREESILSPGSNCPSCKEPIRFFDNIPILSFILLKGRCRSCRSSISWIYPAVETLMGGLTLTLVWRWHENLPAAFLFISFTMFLVAIAFIDLKTLLIPDVLSLSLLGLALALAPVNPIHSRGIIGSYAVSLISSVSGFLFGWGLAFFGEKIFKQEAFGGGDVKLLAGIGAMTGFDGCISSLLSASLLGGGWGIFLIATGKIRKRDPIPFGPFLALGAYISLLFPGAPVRYIFLQ